MSVKIGTWSSYHGSQLCFVHACLQLYHLRLSSASRVHVCWKSILWTSSLSASSSCAFTCSVGWNSSQAGTIYFRGWCCQGDYFCRRVCVNEPSKSIKDSASTSTWFWETREDQNVDYGSWVESGEGTSWYQKDLVSSRLARYEEGTINYEAGSTVDQWSYCAIAG